jgi:hypothetical protein
MYIYDDDSAVPNDFKTTFSWKGVFMSTEENVTSGSSMFYDPTHYWEKLFYRYDYLVQLEVNRLIVEFELLGPKEEIRSKHFNKSSKPPNIDKFKHRSGPKAQKYR